MYPESFRYTKEHEWIDASGEGPAKVGITDHAQSELGDVVHVDLPEVDKDYAANASFGAVESVKAVSDVYMPVAGKVVAVNDALEGSPELVNSSPHEDGWLCQVEVADADALAGLMTASEYEAFLKGA